MLLTLAFIVVAMLFAPSLSRALDARAGWLLALAPLAGFVWMLTQLPVVSSGGVVLESYAWVPALDVALSFRLDGLSLLFGLLVTGIGTLIVLYAGSYLSDHHHLGRFYAYLLGFMAAMLGLVLADDLIALFVFWELTSVMSFLLISFQHENAVSRRAALQALLITGGGGLALLAGLILLGTAADSWQFSTLTAEAVEGHVLYPAILVLVLLGCFTKSAQVPFHLWLPNAMAAPTPVSAYLHSATMVKAGVYLLARLNPVMGGSAGWGTTLIVFGAATALVGAVLALRQTDLKRILAYTTVTVLGQLTMLIGTNTAYGLQAFVIYILAHSLYKGALFMAVGSIDHATGTRELTRLGGLIRFMPLTGAAVALAAFSNAGLPPFFGFIAKEFKYAGLIELGPLGWITTVVMIVTNALLLTAAGLIFIRSFLGRQGAYPRHPHEVSVFMWLGPMTLAIGGFLLGTFNNVAEVWLVNSAVQAVARGPVDVHLYLWGGITPAVIASLLTISLGILAYVKRHAMRRWMTRWHTIWQISGDLLWDRLLKRVFIFAGQIADRFQHGSLRQHIALLALASSVFALLGVALAGGITAWPPVTSPISWAASAGCILAITGAGAAAAMRDRIALVTATGACGLGVALFFLAINAPDVAITQIMVETLTVIFLALVLRKLPPLQVVGSRNSKRRRLHMVVSVLFGLAFTAVLLTSIAGPLPGDIAAWYLANSLPGGHGANVVNVILVDFRAFDTLGEILVVALASIAAANMLGGRSARKDGNNGNPEFGSVLLRQGIKPLAGVLILVSVALLWRGHNLPGGGFIGGLVAASALVILALGYGVPTARKLLRIHPPRLIGVGLALAAGAGLIGLLGQQPFLSSAWIAPGGLALGSPLLFDVGVFLTVLGSMVHMLFRLLEKEA
ncbi:MAG: proton-conducting transporter membrane subunit [Azoarcus sp.]|nr:proton-conducting transporter membrane subunit [Azoarcus sp.]